MLDEDHAVLYGGQTEDGNNKDLFILNIPQWVCDSGLVLHPIILCVDLLTTSAWKQLKELEDLELKRLVLHGPVRYNAQPQPQQHSRECYKEISRHFSMLENMDRLKEVSLLSRLIHFDFHLQQLGGDTCT